MTDLEMPTSAFPPLDTSTEEVLEEFADVPADSDLLAIAPQPILISLEDLLLAIANAPRVIIRRVGIPLAILFTLTVTILLHLAILGFFILGTLHPQLYSNATKPGDEGGGSGYIYLDESSSEPLATDLRTIFPNASELPPIPLPTLTINISSTPIATPNLITKPTEPEIIALAASTTGTPKRRPLALPLSLSAVGDHEGTPLSLVAGSGKGKGRRIGDGVNRGESGANNPNPAVLDAPQVQFPDEFLLNPPKQSAKFEVTVLVSGRPGEITLLQSSGNPNIDTLCAAAIRRYKFRPAYLAGQPIEKTMEITHHFQ
ncbi:MAG: energy transducer TonB [Phycisphaerales bacterium]|nr:energy transducer TonB [Phycisphaerales bacterium]